MQKNIQIKDESGHSIPVLKELGIPVKKKIVLSSFDDIFVRCAHSTYRKAQTGIENALSLGTLHGEFQRRIGELRKEETAGLQYLEEMGYSPSSPVSDTARVMDDAIYIRERTLPGRGKGREQEKRSHLQVQLTRCDFAGSGQDSGGFWTYPPAVYASIEPAKEHIKKGSLYLDIHTGLSRCDTVVHLSDAGANGKRHCRDYNENSLWQLDWYHLARHVRVLNRIDKKWKKEVWELIGVERLDEAIALIESGKEKMKLYSPPVAGDSADFGKKNKKMVGRSD